MKGKALQVISLKKKVMGMATALLLLAGLLVTGCGGGTTGGAGQTGGTEGGMPSGSISAQGSDTMVNLGQNLAEVYMDNVNSGAAVAVTGGGSGTGIAAMINDNTDIAQSSRAMRDSEIEDAAANGVEALEFIIGQDGLAVYVNAGNPLDELDVAQLKAIFTGAVTDWSEVGWAAGGHIDVFSRQSNSGTYVFFNENIMDSEDWAAGARFQPGSAQVVQGVLDDRGGIGYSGVGYIRDGVKALNIAQVGGQAVTPLDANNVTDGSYPIARPLYFYTNGVPEGLVLHYLDWVLSPEGQATVVDSGFYGIHPGYVEINEKTFAAAGVR